MKPLPEVDEFEITESEIKIDLLELADLLILFKCLFPLGFVHRGQSPQDRLPLPLAP